MGQTTAVQFGGRASRGSAGSCGREALFHGIVGASRGEGEAGTLVESGGAEHVPWSGSRAGEVGYAAVVEREARESVVIGTTAAGADLVGIIAGHPSKGTSHVGVARGRSREIGALGRARQPCQVRRGDRLRKLAGRALGPVYNLPRGQLGVRGAFRRTLGRRVEADARDRRCIAWFDRAIELGSPLRVGRDLAATPEAKPREEASLLLWRIHGEVRGATGETPSTLENRECARSRGGKDHK